MSNGEGEKADIVAGSGDLPVIDTGTSDPIPEPVPKSEDVDNSNDIRKTKGSSKRITLTRNAIPLSIIIVLVLIVLNYISPKQTRTQTSDLISNEELEYLSSEIYSPFLIEDGTTTLLNKDEPVNHHEISFDKQNNIAAEPIVPAENQEEKDEQPIESGCQSVHNEDPLCQYDVPYQDKSKTDERYYVTHAELDEYKSHVDQSLKEIVGIISTLSEQLSSAQKEITSFSTSSLTLLQQKNGRQVQSGLDEIEKLASKVDTLESDLRKFIVASKVSAKLKSSNTEVPIPPLRFLILEMFENSLYATFSSRDTGSLVIMAEGERFEGWMLIKATDDEKEQIAILEHIESGRQHTFKAKH